MALPSGVFVIPAVDIGLEGAVEAETELYQIAGSLESVQVPLQESAEIARLDMKRRFDTETDPDGDHWIELDDEYLASKQSLGYPDDILRRTEGYPLETAATSPSAFKVIGDSVWFDASGLPFYGLYHQTGSGAENAGRHRDYRERFAAQKSTGMIGKGEGPHDSLGIGRGNALPRRAFIGLSQEAEAEVIALFEGWFDEATHQIEFYDAPPVSTEPVTSAQFRKLPKEYYVHPGGTVQTRVSGTLPGGKRYGGRFGFGWKPSR